MTWLRKAKDFDLHRNLQNAKARAARAERQASLAWQAYEETKSTRELWRWDRYADQAQLSLLRVGQAEALMRIANNGC